MILIVLPSIQVSFSILYDYLITIPFLFTSFRNFFSMFLTISFAFIAISIFLFFKSYRFFLAYLSCLISQHQVVVWDPFFLQLRAQSANLFRQLDDGRILALSSYLQVIYFSSLSPYSFIVFPWSSLLPSRPFSYFTRIAIWFAFSTMLSSHLNYWFLLILRSNYYWSSRYFHRIGSFFWEFTIWVMCYFVRVIESFDL